MICFLPLMRKLPSPHGLQLSPIRPFFQNLWTKLHYLDCFSLKPTTAFLFLAFLLADFVLLAASATSTWLTITKAPLHLKHPQTPVVFRLRFMRLWSNFASMVISASFFEDNWTFWNEPRQLWAEASKKMQGSSISLMQFLFLQKVVFVMIVLAKIWGSCTNGLYHHYFQGCRVNKLSISIKGPSSHFHLSGSHSRCKKSCSLPSSSWS